MRYLISAIAVLLIVIPGTAAEMFKANTLQLSGQLSYEQRHGEHYAYNDRPYNHLVLSAGPQTFVIDNLSAGFILRYTESWQGDYGEGRLDLGPALTWYFTRTDAGALYVQAAATVGDRTRKLDEKRYVKTLGFGHLFAINKHVGVTASVLHHWHSQEPGPDLYVDHTRHGTEIEFALGFRFFAERKGAGA